MLIIFDLDDTLIQTTDIITPFLLKKLSLLLVEKGVKEDEKEIQKKLFFYNKSSLSAKEALEKFFLNYPDYQDFFSFSVDYIYHHQQEAPVSPYPGAISVLQRLSERYMIYLVTKGKRSIQLKKLKKAGIDSKIFSKIVVSSKGDKRKIYQKILRETKSDADKIIVIGDKPMQDLKPAKELGCTTIHIKQGRGIVATSLHYDFIIHELDKSIPIINQLSQRGKFHGHK